MKYMYRIFFFTIIAFVFSPSLSLWAQSGKKNKAIQQFEKDVEQARQDFHAVGLAVAVIKDGEMVYANGFGLRDQEQQLPVTPNTQFAIGSSSKAFTATTVCKLAEDGKIDLDEPLITYLPDFKLYDEYATEKMTARDLLCHRSGLPRHDLVWYASPKSRKEIFQSLSLLEPTTSFRGLWQYQNLMFMTAGYLVEEVSGKTWEDYTQEHIFDPLGMKTANFSVDNMQKQAEYSLPYSYDWKSGKTEKMDFRNIDAIGPAGSINASVEEMSHWVIMQLAKGKYGDEQIIGESYLQQTHTPHMVIPGGVSDEVFYRSYGLGWMITSYRNHLRVYHGGNIDGFSADVTLFPRDSIGVVVLVNQNGSPLTGVVRNLAADLWLDLEKIDWRERILSDLKKQQEAAEEAVTEEDPNRKMDTKPSHALADYAGKYVHEAYGENEIYLDNDTLKLKMVGQEIPLSHYHYDVFQMETPLGKMKLSFDYDDRGNIHQVSVPLEAGVDDIVFTKVPEIEELDEASLELYAGDYELMGQVGKVFVKDGSLHLFVAGQPEYTLEALGDHQFALKGMDGFTMTFKFEDGKEKAQSLVSSQPNGTFTMKRKE